MDSTKNIPDEILGKSKQLQRLLISYNDFKHASEVGHYFLEGDYYVDRVEWDEGDYYERRIIGEAMNCAMIVSYSRPFSGNDKTALFKIPDLPGRYVRQLDKNGRETHRSILKDRNFIMAHSDSRAWDLNLQFIEVAKGKKILLFDHEDTRAPMSKENIETLISNCNLFMDSIIEARQSLEEELYKFFKKYQAGDNIDA
jgi:hypothetical protein